MKRLLHFCEALAMAAAIGLGAVWPSLYTLIIDRCPLARGGERCRIRQHDWRKRKTGPSVALRVLKCKSHRRAFTVYPPGYVPYGRQAWIPVDPRGYWVNEPESTGKDIRFEGCKFRGLRGSEAREALAE